MLPQYLDTYTSPANNQESNSKGKHQNLPAFQRIPTGGGQKRKAGLPLVEVEAEQREGMKGHTLSVQQTRQTEEKGYSSNLQFHQ